ncbi:hypothetical protein Zmor_025352 [Zophobas morio]|uniref:Uncharacterized protein n=1 Tax=Zophobas morio TaxID=2755281 RepID=A0AA38HRF9_9CUCU|nr:hypothetical protein Zmor_025352 [Zophobas morio]
MKVSLLSFVSLTNLFITVRSGTLTCKVIPFDTKDGISGTCCVIFKNSSKVPFPQDEIKQHILTQKNKEEPEKAKSVDEKVVNSAHGERAKSDDEKLVFNQGNGTLQGKRADEKRNRTEVPKNFTINTKNAFDVPKGCPEGQKMDHTGACTEPF